jgi:mycofactocin system glycosyltransferase
VRFETDTSWQRFGRVVVAGSPLRLFRTSARGEAVLVAIEDHDDVAPSDLVDRLLEAGAIHPAVHPSTELQTGITEPTFTLRDVTIVTPQLGGTVNDDGRITVDDGSMPALENATIRLPVNSGPAAARNAARPLIDTLLIAFVDTDVSSDETEWLAPLLVHFDDPRVGLVAPRICGEQGSPLDLGSDPARIRAGTRVSYVPGAALVVRVEAFDSIGGFDEGLRFGEDVDFVWRMDEADWRCRYEPSSTVWHEPRPTLSGRMRQHVGYGTSAAPLAIRHPDSLAPVRMSAWTAAVWALVAVGHPAIALTTAAGSAAALVPKLPDLPPTASLNLAGRGHLLAAGQLAAAIRRVWWPIVLAASLVSKRMRWIGLAAILVNVRSTPTDVAYGWGVWKGMRRHRSWAPIIPAVSSWPGRQNPPASSTRSTK